MVEEVESCTAPGESPHRTPGYASPAVVCPDSTGDAYISGGGKGIAERKVGSGWTASGNGRLPKPPSHRNPRNILPPDSLFGPSPGVLVLPHLRRRHSRPRSSGDAGIQFRTDEAASCLGTNLRDRSAADEWIYNEVSW